MIARTPRSLNVRVDLSYSSRHGGCRAQYLDALLSYLRSGICATGCPSCALGISTARPENVAAATHTRNAALSERSHSDVGGELTEGTAIDRISSTST